MEISTVKHKVGNFSSSCVCSPLLGFCNLLYYEVELNCEVILGDCRDVEECRLGVESCFISKHLERIGSPRIDAFYSSSWLGVG
jgi:hypothetical protein